MSLQSYLESLRAKPEHIRKRYAFFSSLGLTAIIFMFWIGSFGAVGQSTSNTVAAAVNKTYSPGQSMVAAVGSFFVDIGELMFGAKKVSYPSVEVRPGK